MGKPVIWFDDCYDIVREMWGERLVDISKAITKRLALTDRLTMLPSVNGIAFAAKGIGLIDEDEMNKVIKEEEALARKGKHVSTNMRDATLLRDRMCLRCGTTTNLQIDHIVSIRYGGETILDNLQMLCRKCNVMKRDRCADYRNADKVMFANRLDIICKDEFNWIDIGDRPAECGHHALARPIKIWFRRKLEKIVAEADGSRKSIKKCWDAEIPIPIEEILGSGWFQYIKADKSTPVAIPLDLLCKEIARESSVMHMDHTGVLVFESDEASAAELAEARRRAANRAMWKKKRGDKKDRRGGRYIPHLGE